MSSKRRMLGWAHLIVKRKTRKKKWWRRAFPSRKRKREKSSRNRMAKLSMKSKKSHKKNKSSWAIINSSKREKSLISITAPTICSIGSTFNGRHYQSTSFTKLLHLKFPLDLRQCPSTLTRSTLSKVVVMERKITLFIWINGQNYTELNLTTIQMPRMRTKTLMKIHNFFISRRLPTTISIESGH